MPAVVLQRFAINLCLSLCLTVGVFRPLHAQQAGTSNITGKVIDNKGLPLPGVYVLVMNTSYGTATDENGNYSLSVPKDLDPASKIKFSLLGMKSVEMEYANRGIINLKMQEDKESLDEVVVTGVYNMPRRDMVGSYVTLKVDSILLPAYNSIDEMLQGQVSGMMVKMPMRAGAAPDITIRGQSTLLGATAPLWVVDGIIQPSTQQTSGWWDSWIENSDVEINNIIGSQISWLNPSDIETITILKDASATAIYGSRASNGVISVTTKRGSSERISTRASYNLTVGQRLNYGLYNLMNSQERINFSKEAFEEGVYYMHTPISQPYTYEGMYNMFLSGKISEEEFIKRYNFLETTNTDWFKLVTRPSINQNYRVSVSGGSNKVTYVGSVSYSHNKATEVGNESKRFTGRLALGIELSSKIRFEASISSSLTKTLGFAGANIDPIGYSVQTSRAIPAYELDGSPVFYRVRESYKYNERTVQEGLPYNIFENMANAGSSVEHPTTQATLDFKWTLLPGLTWQVVGGFISDVRNNESWLGENSFHVIQRYRGYRAGSPEAVDPLYRNAAVLKNGGVLITDQTYTQTYDLRNQLNFSRTFADIHRVNLMAMWEITSTYRNSKYNTVFGYDKFRGERIAAPTVPSELRPVGDISAPTDYVDTYLQLSKGYWRSTNFTDNKASLAMIAAYTFNEKYVLNANFRNDWSNTFGQNANKRFNPAFSVGVSWKLAEESFMSETKSWLYVANFRLTYGTQGNVANTQTTEMILQYKPVHPIIEEPYSAISRIANPYMTWERTKSWNAGLDLGFFKNRISLVLDGYTRLSNAGRTFSDTPENGGFTSTLTGTYIRNTGIEGTINLTPLQTRSWRISVGANFSKNWNIIEKEEQSEAATYNTSAFIMGAMSRVIVKDYPLGAFWAYSYAGPDINYGIPNFNYIHAGAYSAEEKKLKPQEFLTYAGSRISDITSGLTIRISYKNLSLHSQLAATLGGKRFLSNPYSAFSNGRMPEPMANLNKELLERWSRNNRNSDFPGLYIVPDESLFYPILLDDPTGSTTNRYTMWAQSDARLASLSTLRCRSINFTWAIGQENTKFISPVLKKLHVRSLDITAAVNNIFLIADPKWRGMDPDLGGDRKAPRSFTFGLNIGF